MIKLVIITSEELNPKNTLSSTFELSQAKILSKIFEVSIISVKSNNSLISVLKKILKFFIVNTETRKETNLKYLFIELKEVFLFLVFRKKIVKRYIIEGITVFEGNGFVFKSSTNFHHNLNVWVKAGYDAFIFFCKEKYKPNIIHAHGRFLNAGALALNIKQKEMVPYVYTEHSTYYQRNIAPNAARPLLSEIIRNAYFFTVVSTSLSYYVNKFLKNTLTNTLVIPNVIDQIFEEPIENNNVPERSFVFLTVSSLDHKKGVDILLKAFKNAFDGSEKYLLKIVGEGLLRNKLEKLRNDLDLNCSVEFLGTKSKFAVKELMDRSNAFVLASRIETFGVVIIEALSRGCPVIATKSGGPEYIINKECGLIVEVENEHELAEALKAMVLRYRDYDKKYIRDRAIAKYGSNTFLESMSKLYNQMLH